MHVCMYTTTIVNITASAARGLIFAGRGTCGINTYDIPQASHVSLEFCATELMLQPELIFLKDMQLLSAVSII